MCIQYSWIRVYQPVVWQLEDLLKMLFKTDPSGSLSPHCHHTPDTILASAVDMGLPRLEVSWNSYKTTLCDCLGTRINKHFVFCQISTGSILSVFKKCIFPQQKESNMWRKLGCLSRCDADRQYSTLHAFGECPNCKCIAHNIRRSK